MLVVLWEIQVHRLLVLVVWVMVMMERGWEGPSVASNQRAKRGIPFLLLPSPPPNTQKWVASINISIFISYLLSICTLTLKKVLVCHFFWVQLPSHQLEKNNILNTRTWRMIGPTLSLAAPHPPSKNKNSCFVKNYRVLCFRKQQFLWCHPHCLLTIILSLTCSERQNFSWFWLIH